MRILHLMADKKLPADPDADGASGVTRVALELAQAQAQVGHEVSVATVTAAAHRQSWTWRGVRLVTLPTVPQARLRVNGRPLDFRQHLPYMLFTRRHSFDVVHGHLYTYMRFLRARCRVVHFHSDPFYPGGENEGFDLKCGDFANILRYSHARVSVSRFVADELERGFDGSGRVEVIYNGVDTDRFHPARWQQAASELRQSWGAGPDDVVFLFSGAIVPEKGVIHLARAFTRAAADLPKIRLAIAGSSGLWGGGQTNRFHYEYENEVRRELAWARAEGRVHFLGKVATSTMPSVYAACDVAVIPSIWREAFPLVAPEALATGRPVIASRHGGLREIVDEAVGTPVEPGDEMGLEFALRTLAGESDLRRRLGLAARERALAYRWSEAAERLEMVYGAALADAERGKPR